LAKIAESAVDDGQLALRAIQTGLRIRNGGLVKTGIPRRVPPGDFLFTLLQLAKRVGIAA
jgi:hypothetical protein